MTVTQESLRLGMAILALILVGLLMNPAREFQNKSAQRVELNKGRKATKKPLGEGQKKPGLNRKVAFEVSSAQN